jgi:hypothetical protein
MKMKKIIILLSVLAIAFTSCKKEKPATPRDTLQTVEFKVGFSQNITVFGEATKKVTAVQTNAADTSITNYVHRINYLIYDATGTFVSEYSNDTGELKVNLAAGNYTVVVLGLEGNNIGKYNQEKLSSLNFNITGEGAVYFKKQSFVVSNSAVTSNVLLSRISSRIVVVAKDNLPVYGNFVFLQILGTSKNLFYAGSETINTGTFFNVPLYVPVSGGAETRAAFDYFYKSPLTVKVGLAQKDARASDYTQLNFKVLNDVPGKVNAITTLTGSFNSVNGSTLPGDSFGAEVDTVWRTPINKGF